MPRRSATWPTLAVAGMMALAACAQGEEARQRQTSAERAEVAASREEDEGAAVPQEAETAASPQEGETPVEKPRGAGVAGVVTLGPRCPAVEAGQECPDRPYSTRLAIRQRSSGRVVASFSSGSDGSFRLELQPGEYVLEPEQAQVVYAPRADPVRFTVEPGKYSHVVVRFDSGVR